MEKPSSYPTLAPLIGGVVNKRQITGHWDEILRLATSIKHGSVTASLMLRKLGAYPRQNGLAVALRELGKIERTLFLLQYISSVELRRRIHVGLNKGEAKNALARAVFFNRLGELRDRTHENQRHRASGLNLVVAAIVLWNTVYLERAVAAIRETGQIGARRDARPPLTAQVGAHQLDRRLPLEKGCRASKPQTAAPQGQQTGPDSLACNF